MKWKQNSCNIMKSYIIHANAFGDGGGVVFLCPTIKRNPGNKNIYMFLSASIHYIYIVYGIGGHHGCDRMVVGFTTTCAISAYHHLSCEFESRSGEVYSIQHWSLCDRVCQWLTMNASQIAPLQNRPRHYRPHKNQNCPH